ncbi:hypothetical protein D3C76_1642660 [compost metagenome]
MRVPNPVTSTALSKAVRAPALVSPRLGAPCMLLAYHFTGKTMMFSYGRGRLPRLLLPYGGVGVAAQIQLVFVGFIG